MSAYFWYLISANLVLTAGYLVFRLIYQREPQFLFHRFYFLALIALAFALPLVSIPIWPQVQTGETVPSTPIRMTVTEVNGTETEAISPEVIMDFSLRGIHALKEATEHFQTLVWLLLMLPSLWLLGKLGVQLISVLTALTRLKTQQYDGQKILVADGVTAPFSFFGWIVLNPVLYTEEQIDYIIQHEHVHARQIHNIDILLAEFLCCLAWFNPVIWALKKAIKQNLEFIADRAVLQSGVDRKRYQYSLVSLNMPNFNHLTVANHFNQSLLKKRIIMMNLNKPSFLHPIKYLLLLPTIGCLFLVAAPLKSQTAKVEGSVSMHSGINTETIVKGTPIMQGEKVFGVISKQVKMEQLQAITSAFADRGIEVVFSNINFTAKGELSSIKIEFTDWSKNLRTLSFGNGRGPIKEKATVYFLHRAEEKSALSGLQEGTPEFEELGSKSKVLRKFSGLLILSGKVDDFKMTLKGNLEEF